MVGLYAGDVAHGVVEGQAEDLDVEVNGIAGQMALGPAPVAVFDDETGVGGQRVGGCVVGAAAARERAGQRGFARAPTGCFQAKGWSSTT